MYAHFDGKTLIEYPTSIRQLKKHYPSTSFPKNFEEFDYASFGVVKVEESAQPDFDPDVEKIVEETPVKVGSKWQRRWTVEPLSTDERQEILSNKANAIRAERDSKLAESDWRIIHETEKSAINGLDIQYPQVWASYRQALRDLPQQPGFPTNVTWPSVPQ